ncbi:hypothetical protein OZ410_09105 [Robiginitalea sp. M366]|uniref:hypothetical protein n=1 Tax=Robiginitalea aestuariiviva TaxID=3036903 RepID=UPI00240E0CED|nr:hypothetical protein [Robiginitalea aestuariiviva]MDG1572472.1 hypothetical protein [Robiginitalea aestuariiviva]
MRAKASLLLKLTLAPILAVFLLYLIEAPVAFYPLAFSLVVVGTNLKRLRLHLLPALGASLGLAYVAFLVGLYGWGFWSKVVRALGLPEDLRLAEGFHTDLAFCLSVFIIAPLLTLIPQKYLFKGTDTRLSGWITLATIVFLVFTGFLHQQTDVDYYLKMMSLWLLLTLLGMQVIINQQAVAALFGHRAAAEEHP